MFWSQFIFFILLLVTMTASTPSAPLHHLIDTSGLKSMAVMEGICSTAVMMPVTFTSGSETVSEIVF